MRPCRQPTSRPQDWASRRRGLWRRQRPVSTGWHREPRRKRVRTRGHRGGAGPLPGLGRRCHLGGFGSRGVVRARRGAGPSLTAQASSSRVAANFKRLGVTRPKGRTAAVGLGGTGAPLASSGRWFLTVRQRARAGGGQAVGDLEPCVAPRQETGRRGRAATRRQGGRGGGAEGGSARARCESEGDDGRRWAMMSNEAVARQREAGEAEAGRRRARRPGGGGGGGRRRRRARPTTKPRCRLPASRLPR